MKAPKIKLDQEGPPTSAAAGAADGASGGRGSLSRITLLQTQLRAEERESEALRAQVNELHSRLQEQEYEWNKRMREMERRLVAAQSWNTHAIQRGASSPSAMRNNPLDERGYASNSDFENL
jgi:hypothetical protein